MEVVVAITCLLAGLIVGMYLGRKYSVSPVETQPQYIGLQNTNIQLKTTLDHIQKENESLNVELSAITTKFSDLEKAEVRIRSEREALESALQNQKQEFDKLQKQMLLQFENLANKVMQQSTNQFQETSSKNIEAILNPFKERIVEFQKTVIDTYSKESRERLTLANEINRLSDSTQKITLEAGNLTKAMKGDVKQQGNWGEIVLERILERSSLRKGEEYIPQGENLGMVTEDGKRQKPDYLIRLPENKHVILDSKVSITNLERFIAAEDESEKAAELKNYPNSIYKHVDGLSEKNYQGSNKLNAPDYVMMFLPSDGAYALALQSDPEINLYARERGIVLVCPSMLMPLLMTVASLWNQDRQSKNALQIAEQAGALYDKFVGFVSDMNTIGQNMQKAAESHEGAMNKLKDGRGNIISRIEGIKKLGAKASKSLPQNLVTEEEEDKKVEIAEIAEVTE